MAEFNFNTQPGQVVERHLMIAALNTGTAEAPEWSPVGVRVEDSSVSYDWNVEHGKDIFNNTYSRGRTPVITQTFEPWAMDSGDTAQKKIWNLAVKDQNVAALMAQEMLIIHKYAGDDGKFFTEHYKACSVLPTDLGGEGGGFLGMAIDVTYGGERTLGAATIENGVITFTQEVTV